jgi:imidazolonepropionase-like amidohydrolase
MDDIRDLVGLAKEYNYRLVLEGVQEGWLLADELNSAGVSVIVTPRNQMAAREGFEDTSGSSIAMAAVLESAGVPFAINAMSGSIGLGGIVGRDLMSLPFEAAFAVRGGASEQAALAAITIVPAELLGLQDRIGSLEEGKDADILIMDAHPLDYRAYVETAFVNGKVYYRRDVNRVFPVFKRTDR